jgi:hypothetical protein
VDRPIHQVTLNGALQETFKVLGAILLSDPGKMHTREIRTVWREATKIELEFVDWYSYIKEDREYVSKLRSYHRKQRA